MSVFDDQRHAISRCEGYAIDLLSLSLVDGSDVLEIGLRWGPSKPDMVVSLRKIYYFAIGRSPSDEVPLVDRIETAEVIPSFDGWPEGLDGKMNLLPTPELPRMLWLRTDGPVRLEVVAAVATVHEEVHVPQRGNA